MSDYAQHPEYQALLRGVLENPDDDAPRLIISDWLEEHDQYERAEYIRNQLRNPDDFERHHSLYYCRGFGRVLDLPQFCVSLEPFKSHPITEIIYRDNIVTLPDLIGMSQLQGTDDRQVRRFALEIVDDLSLHGFTYEGLRQEWLSIGMPTGMTDGFMRNFRGLSYREAIDQNAYLDRRAMHLHRVFLRSCVNWHRKEIGLPAITSMVW